LCLQINPNKAGGFIKKSTTCFHEVIITNRLYLKKLILSAEADTSVDQEHI